MTLHGEVTIHDDPSGAPEDGSEIWVKVGPRHIRPIARIENRQYRMTVDPRRNAQNETLQFYIKPVGAEARRAHPTGVPAVFLPLKFSHGSELEVHLELREGSRIELHQGNPPHTFAGTAYIGESLATNAIITGRVTVGDSDRTVAITRSDEAGKFSLSVNYQDSRTHGSPVFFTVSGRRANRSGEWKAGEMTLLELNTTPIPIRVKMNDLIIRGNLVTVLKPDPSRGEWQVFNPEPAWAEYNTLESVLPGDTIWIVVSKTSWFEGQTLSQGENVVTLR